MAALVRWRGFSAVQPLVSQVNDLEYRTYAAASRAEAKTAAAG